MQSVDAATSFPPGMTFTSEPVMRLLRTARGRVLVVPTSLPDRPQLAERATRPHLSSGSAGERRRDVRVASAPDLLQYQKSVFSQHGQDGLIAEIMRRLGIHRGSSLEVGGRDGVEWSNTRALFLSGWDCTYIEADPNLANRIEQNTAGRAKWLVGKVSLERGSTLDDMMERLAVPRDLTLLCIDIDGNDYWVWKSLTRCSPIVVCIEYNSNFEPHERRVVEYDPDMQWDGTTYYGASAGAIYDLAIEKGYVLVAYIPQADLFFLRKDIYGHHRRTFRMVPVTELVKMPLYPGSERIMVPIDPLHGNQLPN